MLGCVLLLLLMRALNLAVPIAYKRLVDQLAAATSAPPDQRPSFRSLLEPWCERSDGGGGEETRKERVPLCSAVVIFE